MSQSRWTTTLCGQSCIFLKFWILAYFYVLQAWRLKNDRNWRKELYQGQIQENPKLRISYPGQNPTQEVTLSKRDCNIFCDLFLVNEWLCKSECEGECFYPLIIFEMHHLIAQKCKRPQNFF